MIVVAVVLPKSCKKIILSFKQKTLKSLCSSRGLTLHQYFELLIKLLDSCDMQCVMCGQQSQEERRTKLSFSMISNYFGEQSFKDKLIYLWGGEPLLHRELHDFIAFFKKRGAIVAMNTNGYKLSQHIERLIADGLDRIIFSMDGSDAATHDRIRGVPGSFSRLQANVAQLCELKKEAKVPLVRINFVVLPQNHKQILEVLDWCRQHAIYRVHFQLPIFLMPAQLEAYANLVRTECGCAIRNYHAFVLDFSDMDFSVLERSMRIVHEQQNGFARFHPYEYLSATELRTYFTSAVAITDCRCIVSMEKLAIDASGRFVTCPDFPDISFGDIEHGVTNPERLRWLFRRFKSGNFLPVCNRCCHFLPQS